MKELLRKAADHVGETMTEFATRALSERAEKVLARPRGPLPTYFRALAARAAAGGEGNWTEVGYAFAQGCVSDLMNEIGDDDAEKEIRRLERVASRSAPKPPTTEDLDAVLAWFDKNFPRCMALVPDRRRRVFAFGVVARVQRKGIDI